ncbi:LuxR family transcriptional regulator [Pseudomonas syringae]|uniref:LuxR family transcriptional regulator n=1 Tax=Pseudomonas syringae TaxID=317 RepID=A0A244ETT6_PSESX|nr:helix-turn-helix transcriptional regulator [Pseudomonas syringae]MCI3945720.1 LuxR family transcriptional regulator [Pseudomonas syringae]OUM07818.1 LuxR family transcriptional regulator [Pseudomonas syringae]
MKANLRMTGNQSAYFLELGRLISSVGDARFASNMYQMIAATVPIDFLDLSEWTIDEHEGSIISIQPLGRETSEQKPATSPVSQDNEMLLARMVNVDDFLLIHLKPPFSGTPVSNCSAVTYQCNLVSRKSNRRCVISLHRQHPQRDFSLHELSFLKNFSEALLPLLERHAQATRTLCTAHADNDAVTQGGQQLQREFNEKLSHSEVRLSLREKEICLGLLAGATVPELADKLHVKNSSIETYLKRAAAKLGVKGRHGLVKWMTGVTQTA